MSCLFIILCIIPYLILSNFSLIHRIIQRIRYRIRDRHKMTLCHFLPINLSVILSIILSVILSDLGITDRITGKITDEIILLPTYIYDTFSINATHFLDENEWHKAPPSGYFLRLDACEKSHSPKPVKLTAFVWPPPFFALYLVAQKCGGQTLRLTGGFAPKTKLVHWGSLAIAGACHFVSAPPVFPFLRWTLIRRKTKSLPPSFYSVGQIASCHKTSLCLSAISHRFTCQFAWC